MQLAIKSLYCILLLFVVVRADAEKSNININEQCQVNEKLLNRIKNLLYKSVDMIDRPLNVIHLQKFVV